MRRAMVCILGVRRSHGGRKTSLALTVTWSRMVAIDYEENKMGLITVQDLRSIRTSD